jgi:hypothetical protein
MADIRERNELLEGELAKLARVGKREEMTFEEEVRTRAGGKSAASSKLVIPRPRKSVEVPLSATRGN